MDIATHCKKDIGGGIVARSGTPLIDASDPNTFFLLLRD
jgi:hypothetical protein